MTERAHSFAWLYPLTLVLSTAVAVLAAWVWTLTSHGLPQEQLEAMELVHGLIQREHIDPPPSEELMWAAIEAMVARTDPHSEFISPSEAERFEASTSGTYEGIGIMMAAEATPLTVEFPFEGGPAEAAGLRVGDQILAVDGVPLESEDYRVLHAQARERLLGPPGTKVDLLVQRDAGEPFEVTVTRGVVQRPSVKWARLLGPSNRIGYVYVSAFQDHTADELADELAALEQRAGAPLRALILDLRWNRGGLLEQALALVNQLLCEGVIVTLKERGGETVQEHRADPALCTHPDLPIVILANHVTASASEVVIGALRDHGRAVLVGTQTYGKAVVQSIYRWEGADYLLKLTTAHYYTPSGESIGRGLRRPPDEQGNGGFEPDVEVALTDGQARAIAAVLQHVYEPPPRYAEATRALLERLGRKRPQPLGVEKDPQLAAALEVALRQAEAEAEGEPKPGSAAKSSR